MAVPGAATTLPELLAVEGDEEVEYVLLDLPKEVTSKQIRPGAQVTFKGLDSDNPIIVLEDGVELQGLFQAQLGTVLLFQHPQSARTVGQTEQQQGSVEGAAAAGEGEGTAVGVGQTQSRAGSCKFIGMTESRLVVRPSPEVAPPQEQ